MGERPTGNHWSIALEEIPDPDFADIQIVAVPGDRPLVDDAAWWARQVFDVRSAPRWIRWLLGLRQFLVRLIGVARAGTGVFDVDAVRAGEALISEDDQHLDFRAAVGIDTENRLLRVTTAVRLHGRRGRLYWSFVRLLHGPVTRSMMERAVRRSAHVD